MDTGYFAGMRTGLYRRTRDGRRVCARRLLLPWRKRWFYVTPEQEAPYERKMIRTHILSMSVMILFIAFDVDRILGDPLWFLALLLILPLPALLPWTTAGLAPAPIGEADLEPVDRAAAALAYSRATGRSTLWLLLIAGVLMAAGQLYVLVTDGAWWSWMGLAMFSLSAAYMGVQLRRLKKADSTP